MLWTDCMIDASMSHGGMFCFCPVEMDGDEVTEVVEGMNFLSHNPPERMRLRGVFHPDGQDACERWCEENRDALDTLRNGRNRTDGMDRREYR